MHDFDRDNAWQRRIRDEILVPHYRAEATEGRYVLLDRGNLATRLQKELAVDTIFQIGGGEIVSVEEKIVRWPGYTYTAFCMETHSCTVPGRESQGWMVYGSADCLLYCFATAEQGLDCHMINFPRLKEWFWPIYERFDTFGPMDSLNKSMGRKVPIVDVYANVPARQFFLAPTVREVAA